MQETIKKVQSKAYSMVEKTKIQATIATKTVKMDALFEDLGRAFYDVSDALTMDEPMAAIITEIKATEEELQTLKDDAKALSNQVRCTCCGEYFDADMMFCGHCGTKKPEPVVEPEVEETETPEETTEE